MVQSSTEDRDDYWYLDESSTGIGKAFDELRLSWVRWCRIPGEDNSWVAKPDACSNNMLANVACATNDEDPALLHLLVLLWRRVPAPNANSWPQLQAACRDSLVVVSG